MPRALPVRGGAAAVEQAGLGQDVGAGADAGDADAALRDRPHEGQRRSSHVAAASTPSPPATISVVIAPDGLKLARQHLDARRASAPAPASPPAP